jgi:hypothetical protein
MNSLKSANTPVPFFFFVGVDVKGGKGSNSPSLKGWMPKADGVVRDTPFERGRTPHPYGTPL